MEYCGAVLRALIRTLVEPLGSGEAGYNRVRVVSQIYQHLVHVANQGIDAFEQNNPQLLPDSTSRAKFAEFLDSIRLFHDKTFPDQPIINGPQFNPEQLIEDEDFVSVRRMLESLDITEHNNQESSTSSTGSWEPITRDDFPNGSI
ncbi:hypothetical protein TRVA0_032S00342 [Trichomonascus vanleenenianus]|uniref:uncharacterized protein n=1 Tax=Trichomonascus vanleenenianus TaxID=2268995 RepID=UPI003ECA7E50